MIAAILAASITFTATATGVGRGTPVEFVFAGPNTDRGYESMFLIDGSVDDFCTRLEAAGLKPGRPIDARQCRFWPIGTPIRFEPALTNFIEGTMPQGLPSGRPIYTGGARLEDGRCDAGTNMPASVFSIYTLAQSPIVLDGFYGQGAVYNAFTARKTLKKGERFSFKVSWDEKGASTKSLHLTVRPGNASEIIRTLKAESEKCAVEALVGFADDLTVGEAAQMANALATIDSPRIKVNGCSNLFYRAFLPLVKWRDRKERIVQPFELTLGGTTEKLVVIEEDWSVEGMDPKLTPKEIPFDAAASYAKTDTCFIFASAQTPISRIRQAMDRLKGSHVGVWYVFTE